MKYLPFKNAFSLKLRSVNFCLKHWSRDLLVQVAYLIQYNDASKIVFWNKKILSIQIKKKIRAIGLNSDFFHLISMVHCLFTFHYANKYNIPAF